MWAILAMVSSSLALQKTIALGPSLPSSSLASERFASRTVPTFAALEILETPCFTATCVTSCNAVSVRPASKPGSVTLRRTMLGTRLKSTRTTFGLRPVQARRRGAGEKGRVRVRGPGHSDFIREGHCPAYRLPLLPPSRRARRESTFRQRDRQSGDLAGLGRRSCARSRLGRRACEERDQGRAGADVLQMPRLRRSLHVLSLQGRRLLLCKLPGSRLEETQKGLQAVSPCCCCR